MPSHNQFAFEADLEKFAKRVELDLGTAKRKIAFDLFGKIVNRTPVDKGLARASWQMNDRVPSPKEIMIATTAAKKSPAEATAEAFSNITARFQNPFDVVVISNNVPYIVKLEFGHSKTQAPSGMVRVSLAEAEAGLLAS